MMRGEKRMEEYWQEGIDSKAFLVELLYCMPYMLLLGVAGAVIGSGLYLIIMTVFSGPQMYQAETEYYIDFAEGRLEAKDYYNDATWNDVMATDLILGNTMSILVKDVTVMRSIGTTAIAVRINSILSVPLSSPLPLSYVIVRLFAMFSSFSSSPVWAEPGSLIFVLFSSPC